MYLKETAKDDDLIRASRKDRHGKGRLKNFKLCTKFKLNVPLWNDWDSATYSQVHGSQHCTKNEVFH